MGVMAKLSALVIMLACVSVAGDKKAQQNYDALVQRIKAHDQTINFIEFRMAAGKAGIASDLKARNKLMEAVNKRDFKQMSVAAEAVLKTNYADMDGHYFAKIAAQQLGDPQGAEFHRWVEIGLLNALRSSGDGKSVDTAMKVISVDEEYFIIRMMGQQPKKQSLGSCAGNPCDIYTTYDPETQKAQTWYFDVSVPMGRMAKALGEQ